MDDHHVPLEDIPTLGKPAEELEESGGNAPSGRAPDVLPAGLLVPPQFSPSGTGVGAPSAGTPVLPVVPGADQAFQPDDAEEADR